MNSYTSSKYIADLGAQLERYRLLQNVPQIELAEKAGISVRTLRRFESGEGGSLDSFIRLLMALKLDNNLSVLIPDATVRPMERARQAKTERLRASGSKNTHPKAAKATSSSIEKRNTGRQSNSGWVWGDEEP